MATPDLPAGRAHHSGTATPRRLPPYSGLTDHVSDDSQAFPAVLPETASPAGDGIRPTGKNRKSGPLSIMAIYSQGVLLILAQLSIYHYHQFQ